jgi:hypothetical protein
MEGSTAVFVLFATGFSNFNGHCTGRSIRRTAAPVRGQAECYRET